MDAVPAGVDKRISIHAPKGGATFGAGKRKRRNADFNPRSQGGSDKESVQLPDTITDFNPRSQGGSDPTAADQPRAFDISIHAPKGGATCLYAGRIAERYFNPRSQGGSDG